MAERQGREGDPPEGVLFICPGLMRTGLQSLAEALRILGYEHIIDRSNVFECQDLWIKAMNNQATKEDFQKKLKGAQVVMGLPTFVFWEQILEAFPQARVILTTREEAAWYRSVLEAKQQLDSEAPAAPLRSGQFLRAVECYMMPSYNKLCDVLRFSWASALGLSFLGGGQMNKHVTCGMFRKHNMYVCNRVPKDRLLVMDVRQGWVPLCSFVGADRPTVPFPAVHDVPYFSLTKHEHKRRKGLQESEGAVLEQAMVKELRRGLLAVSVAVLVLLAIVMIPLLQETPLVVMMVLTTLAAHLAVSIWLAVKYIVRRLPVTTALPAALKVIFVSIGINLVFLVYGILKEDLVTQTRMPSIYIVMVSRLMAVCAGALGVWSTHGLRQQEGKRLLGASILDFAMFSTANEISTWASYEMLKYVSFAVQTMAKSLTVLPAMLMGWLLRGSHYTMKDWGRAAALVLAVAVMQLGDDAGTTRTSTNATTCTSTNATTCAAPPGRGVGAGEGLGVFSLISMISVETQMGMLLTVLFLFFDAFCSQYQSKLTERFPSMSHYQMMLGGSLFAVLFEGIIAVGTVVAHGGAPPMPLQNHAARKLLFVALCNAVGQVLIYYTIKEFGSVVFAWIMTTRKVISVVFSFLWFRHHISWMKICCICVVFGIIILNQVFKPPKKSGHGHGHGTSKGSSSHSSAMPGKVNKKNPVVRRFSSDNLNWSETSTSAASASGESDDAYNSDSPVEDAGDVPKSYVSKLGGIKESCAESKKTQ